MMSSYSADAVNSLRLVITEIFHIPYVGFALRVK